MFVEVAIVISLVSLIFGIWSATSNLRRADRFENKTDATQLTTVIVKLESISNGVNEIKTEMMHVKTDIRDTREKLIKIEESVKHAHKRIDCCERSVKSIFADLDEEEAL